MNKHILKCPRYALAALVVTAACASGPDPAAIRTSISAKLQTAQPTIQDCFQRSLTTNRKLRGMYVVQMAVTEQGQFTDISLRRDEPADPVLRFCVIQTLAKLKLDKPPGQRIAVESVPIKFEWTNP